MEVLILIIATAIFLAAKTIAAFMEEAKPKVMIKP